MSNNNKLDGNELERFIEFCLGGENYAIPLLMVREVISIPETTPIPKAPPHFLGIMNLRGQVISIIDLRTKLKIKPSENSDQAVIIVDFNGMNIGVVVDSINKVLAFSRNDAQQMSELDSQQLSSDYILGVFKKVDGLTVLLDIAKSLDVKDMNILQVSAAKLAAA